MSWRDQATEDCDLYQALYRDDGAPLGVVLRLHGGDATYAYTMTYDALRRLSACPTDDAARRAVEQAVGTEEGALVAASRRVTRPAGRSRGDPPFSIMTPLGWCLARRLAARAHARQVRDRRSPMTEQEWIEAKADVIDVTPSQENQTNDLFGPTGSPTELLLMSENPCIHRAPAAHSVPRIMGSTQEDWLEHLLRRGEELARRLVVTPTPTLSAAARHTNLYASAIEEVEAGVAGLRGSTCISRPSAAAAPHAFVTRAEATSRLRTSICTTDCGRASI